MKKRSIGDDYIEQCKRGEIKPPSNWAAETHPLYTSCDGACERCIENRKSFVDGFCEKAEEFLLLAEEKLKKRNEEEWVRNAADPGYVKLEFCDLCKIDMRKHSLELCKIVVKNFRDLSEDERLWWESQPSLSGLCAAELKE